jgi:hypothetical protein
MAPQASQAEIRRQFVPAAATTVAVRDEAMPLVGDGQAQQTRQANQLGQLVPAVSAARKVGVDDTAIGGPDYAKDVDPQFEADRRARAGAGHGAWPSFTCPAMGKLRPSEQMPAGRRTQ